VNDATAVVAALEGRDLEERAGSALALLALVAGQDVEPAEGSDGTGGRWRIARQVAGDRVISTVDPDARHTRKSGEARRDGYRAHVAADPETGIITDEKLTGAAGQDNSDPAVAEEFVAGEAAGDSAGDTDVAGPLAWYGDSAYGTGDLRDAIGKAGHQAVIKPRPLRPPVQGGCTVDDFTVSEEQGTVTCPAGHTVPLSRTRSPSSAPCAGAARCARGAPPARPAASLSCTPATTCSAPPAGWTAGSGLRKDYTTHRPNVERAIAQVATWRGRRLKLRYRGTPKNHAWLKRRTAALNLRNLTGKGLTRRGGARAPAT
jgi:hypothetical protein